MKPLNYIYRYYLSATISTLYIFYYIFIFRLKASLSVLKLFKYNNIIFKAQYKAKTKFKIKTKIKIKIKAKLRLYYNYIIIIKIILTLNITLEDKGISIFIINIREDKSNNNLFDIAPYLTRANKSKGRINSVKDSIKGSRKTPAKGRKASNRARYI